MKEYIEREAALNKLRQIRDYFRSRYNGSEAASIAEYCRDALIDIPTAADVAEVRHAKNIAKDYADCDQFVCEKCGVELQGWYRVERDIDDGDETHHEYVFRYCPNCGAKMDGSKTTERKCGSCIRTDGRVYTSYPPKVRCTITGKFHDRDDDCDVDGGVNDGKLDTHNSFYR